MIELLPAEYEQQERLDDDETLFIKGFKAGICLSSALWIAATAGIAWAVLG